MYLIIFAIICVSCNFSFNPTSSPKPHINTYASLSALFLQIHEKKHYCLWSSLVNHHLPDLTDILRIITQSSVHVSVSYSVCLSMYKGKFVSFSESS